MLEARKDKFRGMTIKEESVQSDREVFREQLMNSLKQWQDEGIRGIWLKLSEKNSHLIDIAVKEGQFKFHHAKNDYVMMTRWLPKDLNKMPGFATHYVGVGGLVLSKDRKRILAI